MVDEEEDVVDADVEEAIGITGREVEAVEDRMVVEGAEAMGAEDTVVEEAMVVVDVAAMEAALRMGAEEEMDGGRCFIHHRFDASLCAAPPALINPQNPQKQFP